MAFPVVQARNANASTGNSTGAYTATLPASIAAGDLLVAAVAKDGTGVLTFGSGLAGWNVLFSSFSSGAGLTFFYKVAVGGEGTLSVAGPAENFIGRTLRLTGYDPNLPPAFATATASTTNPDPPVLDPADWATEDTLWLAIAAGDCTAAAGTISAAPTNYTTNASLQTTTDATTTNRVVMGFGERSLNAGSENPGTFTRAQSDNYLAATVAIRTAPAAPKQPILYSTGFYSASGTAPTNNITIVAGTNRRLMVSVMIESGTVSSMTCGGVSMALVTDGTNTATSTNTARTEWWTLPEGSLPSNGTQSLVVNLSASLECYINAILVSGTDQSTNVNEVNNASTAGATTVTTTVTVDFANSLILSASQKNNTPHFTNFTVGGVRAMGRGSCALPTGGAFMMNVAREVTATGSTTAVSTGTSERQVMSTVLLAPVPVLVSGAVTSSSATSGAAGGAAPTFVDWDHDVQQGSAADTVVATMPPLAAVGDYILAFITTTQDGTPNTPSGWTFLGSTTVGATTSTPECAVYGRFKQGGDPSTVNFTNGLSSANGYGLTAQTMAFNGVNTSNPVDVTATTSNGAGAPPDPASITTVTDNCMIAVIGFMDNGSGTLVKPSGYTDPIGTTDSNSGGGGSDNGARSTICYKAITTAGAENPPAFTTDTNDEHGAITIALRPAGGGNIELGTAATSVSGANTTSAPATAGTLTTSNAISGAVTTTAPQTAATFTVPKNVTGAVTSSAPATAATLTVPKNVTGAVTSSAPSTAATLTVPKNVTGAVTSSAPATAATFTSSNSISGAVTSSAPATAGTLVSFTVASGANTTSAPATAATLTVPKNVTGAVASSAPSTAATLESAKNVTGANTSSAPAVSGTLTTSNAVSGAVTTTAPQTAATFRLDLAVSGSNTSSAPATAGTVSVVDEDNVTGAVTTSAPSTAGTMTVPKNVTGSVTSSSPATAATFQVVANVSAAVASSSPATAATFRLDLNLSAAVTTSAPQTTGSISVVDEKNVSGALASSAPATSGSLETIVSITGTLNSSAPATAGTVQSAVNVTGALTSSPAGTTGTVQVAKNVTGAVASSPPSTTGLVELVPSVSVSGVLASAPPAVTGTFSVVVRVTGALATTAPATLGAVVAVQPGGNPGFADLEFAAARAIITFAVAVARIAHDSARATITAEDHDGAL